MGIPIKRGVNKSTYELLENCRKLTKNGNYKKAGSCYEKLLKEDRTNPDAWYGIGNLKLIENNLAQAIECFNTGLKFQPDHIDLLLKKAWTLNKKKKYEEAIDCCNYAIESDPDCAEAWNYKGYAYNKKGEHSEAIKCAERAKSLDIAVTSLYYAKSLVFEKK